MRSFRRYRVFISSTFRDMDFERDVIKFKVIPRINAELKKYNAAVEAVDLRIGINTGKLSEAEAARKVLNVCTQTIDSARPFFVGLIGGRYGWIPSDTQWQEFTHRLPADMRSELKDTHGKSVTEIEIVYGALSQRSLDSFHSVFFMRNPDSYDGMSAHTLGKYVDTDPELNAKLQNLKSLICDRINSHGGDDDAVVPYSLKWDNDAECFHNSPEFEELAYSLLMYHIVKEINAEEFDEYWKLEKHAAEAALNAKLYHVSTELPYMGEMVENTCFVGDYGSGKSTILANQWRMYTRQTNDICLLACLRTSSAMTIPEYILTMWCLELASVLGEEPCDQNSFLTNPDIGIQTICDDFYYMVKKAGEQGRRVTIFIDDVDTFLKVLPHGASLPWLDLRVNIIATASIDSYEYMMPYHLYMDFVDLEELPKSRQLSLMKALQQRYFMELPDKLIKAITQRPHPPGYINSLYRYFGMMDSGDFDVLRSAPDYQKALEEYLTDIYTDCFLSEDDETMLPTTLLSSICAQYGYDEEWYQSLFACLGASPCGLTISDLRGIAGEGWDETEWQQIKYFMQDYLDEDFCNGMIYSKFKFFGLDDDTPYSVLYDYFQYDDRPLAQDIFAYSMLHSERGAEDFTEEAFPLSAAVVYTLLSEDWFTNGDMDDYCKLLDWDQKHELMSQLAVQLKSCKSVALCPAETRHAFDNFALIQYDCSEREKKEITDTYKAYKDTYYANIAEALEKIYAIAPGLRDATSVATGLNNNAEAAYRLKEKGAYLDELKVLGASVEAIYDIIKDQERINNEPILEYLMLTMLHVYGAANRVLNDNSLKKKIRPGIVEDIGSYAEDCFVMSYLRLRQGYPLNNSLREVAVIGERCAYDILNLSGLSSHSDVLRDMLYDITEFISRL